jgi:predicted dehydrogenase
LVRKVIYQKLQKIRDENFQNVKIGVVGCGDVALDTYLPTLSKLRTEGKVEIQAVCDKAQVRAETCQKLFNVKESFTNYDQMLASDIDAVVILTPHRFHAPLSLLALKAGKHVYSEKPMAQKIEDADLIVSEASKNRKLKFGSAPAISLTLENIKAREIIQTGMIGKIAYCRAFGSSAGPMESVGQFTDARWYYSDEPTGPLLTRTVYTLHSLSAILGPVKRVSAFSARSFPIRKIENLLVDDFKPYEIEHVSPDNYMVILDFGNQTLGLVDGTFCCKSPYDQTRWDGEYYGSEGIVYMNDMTTGLRGPLEVYLDKEVKGFARGWLKPFPPRSEFWREKIPMENLGLIHWVNCILEDQQPLNSVEHARHVVEVALKAVKSTETGQAQEIQSTFNLDSIERFKAVWEKSPMPTVSGSFGFA